jgi:hypothetical protein
MRSRPTRDSKLQPQKGKKRPPDLRFLSLSCPRLDLRRGGQERERNLQKKIQKNPSFFGKMPARRFLQLEVSNGRVPDPEQPLSQTQTNTHTHTKQRLFYVVEKEFFFSGENGQKNKFRGSNCRPLPLLFIKTWSNGCVGPAGSIG